MTEQIHDRDELKRQCHQLIEAIATRPGAVKLLQGILDQARVFAQYKSDRKFRPAHPPKVGGEAPLVPRPEPTRFNGRCID